MISLRQLQMASNGMAPFPCQRKIKDDVHMNDINSLRKHHASGKHSRMQSTTLNIFEQHIHF